MTDVFVSYSRKDQPFVRRVCEALKEHGREAWVDWEDIPPSAKWRSEIEAAIEAAETFVFVLGPDSLRSEICAEEIRHAVLSNKRLIPVVCRDIEATSVPRDLAELNWIFLRDSDDFPGGIDALVRAIETDLPWVREHTRLLVRATEWDRATRDGSLVLRGRELRAAEEWLVRAGRDTRPEATPLQREYILASRRAAGKRQRVLLISVIAGLVVALGLAVLAWLNAREAKRQANVALARQLSVRAGPWDEGGDVEQTLRLAAEAERRLASTGGASLPEIDGLLRRALDASPYFVGGLQMDWEVKEFALDPLASSVAATTYKSARRLDLGTRVPSPPHPWDPNAPDRIWFAPDARFLVASHWSGGYPTSGLRVWDLAANALAAKLTVPGRVEVAALTPGASLLALRSESEPMRLLDLRRNARAVQQFAREWWGAFFSPAGKHLGLWADDRVALWRLAQTADAVVAELVAEFPAKYPGLDPVFSPDGRWLLTVRPGGSGESEIEIRDTERWEVAARTRLPHDDIRALSADGRLVLANSEHAVAVVDLASGRVIARNAPPAGAGVFVGRDAYYAGFPQPGLEAPGNSLLITRRVSTRGSDWLRAELESGNVLWFAADPRGGWGAVVQEKDAVVRHEWSASSEGGRKTSARFPGQALALSADGRFLAEARPDGRARVLDLRSGGPVFEGPYAGPPKALAMSADGGFLAIVASGGRTGVWRLTGGGAASQPMATLDLPALTHTVAVSLDGAVLAAIRAHEPNRRGDTATVEAWSTRPVKRLTSLTLGSVGDQRMPCGISPDAKLVALTSGEVLELATGKPVSTVDARDPGRCAFDASGRLLATAAGSTTAVWDLTTRRQIIQIDQDGAVEQLLFAREPGALATVAVDRAGRRELRVWMLRPDDLVAEACRRMSRNITLAEWDVLTGVAEAYQKTCPALP